MLSLSHLQTQEKSAHKLTYTHWTSLSPVFLLSHCLSGNVFVCLCMRALVLNLCAALCWFSVCCCCCCRLCFLRKMFFYCIFFALFDQKRKANKIICSSSAAGTLEYNRRSHSLIPYRCCLSVFPTCSCCTLRTLVSAAAAQSVIDS